MPTTRAVAPYRHTDGGNCWTKDCSRDRAPKSFGSFLAWAGQADLSAGTASREAELAKRFLAANRIRRGPEDFTLTEAHRDERNRVRALMDKQEWDDVHYYMQYGYRKVNAYLRGGQAWQDFLDEDRAEKVDRWGYKDWSPEQLEEEADVLLNRLDKAFETVASIHPAGEQQLYRYEMIAPEDSLEQLKQRYQPGSRVTLPAYTSTTVNPNLIISAANQDQHKDREMVVFEIISHRGINLHTGFATGGGVTAEEQEVLLPRGSEYRVHRVIEAPYQTGYSTRVQERLGYYGYRDNWKKPITKQRYTVIQLIDVTA